MKAKDAHLDTEGHIVAGGLVHAVVLKLRPQADDENVLVTPRGVINLPFVPCGIQATADPEWTADELTCPGCVAAVHLPYGAKPQDHVYCPACYPGTEADQFAEKVAKKQAWDAGRADRVREVNQPRTATLTELADQIATTYDIDDTAARDSVRAWAEQLDDEYDIETGDLTAQGVSIITAQAAATWGSAAVPDPEMRDARTELREAQAAVSAAEQNLQRRDAAVRAALAAGIPVKDIVADTELSRSRVYQIRDGRR